MAPVKKLSSVALDTASEGGKSFAASSRDAEAQLKKARTLAKQQQAAERIAAATAQLSSGSNQAAPAVEELKVLSH